MIKIHFRENQLGSDYLKKDLHVPSDIEIITENPLDITKGSVAIGQSFQEDQFDLKSSRLHYHSYGLEDETPLNQRSFHAPSLLHLDLKIVDPLKASAVESHNLPPQKYIKWEDLMKEVLGLSDKVYLHAFCISGFCPDRDRSIGLNHKSNALHFHLNSSQETHQFTQALMYNCIEVLTKTIKGE